MDPVRLHFFLACALTTYALSTDLARALFTQALRHYHERLPLVGCGVTHGGATTFIIAVGRN